MIETSAKKEPRVCLITTASDDALHSLNLLISGLKQRFLKAGSGKVESGNLGLTKVIFLKSKTKAKNRNILEK